MDFAENKSQKTDPWLCQVTKMGQLRQEVWQQLMEGSPCVADRFVLSRRPEPGSGVFGHRRRRARVRVRRSWLSHLNFLALFAFRRNCYKLCSDKPIVDTTRPFQDALRNALPPATTLTSFSFFPLCVRACFPCACAHVRANALVNRHLFLGLLGVVMNPSLASLHNHKDC